MSNGMRSTRATARSVLPTAVGPCSRTAKGRHWRARELGHASATAQKQLGPAPGETELGPGRAAVVALAAALGAAPWPAARRSSRPGRAGGSRAPNRGRPGSPAVVLTCSCTRSLRPCTARSSQHVTQQLCDIRSAAWSGAGTLTHRDARLRAQPVETPSPSLASSSGVLPRPGPALAPARPRPLTGTSKGCTAHAVTALPDRASAVLVAVIRSCAACMSTTTRPSGGLRQHVDAVQLRHGEAQVAAAAVPSRPPVPAPGVDGRVGRCASGLEAGRRRANCSPTRSDSGR
jgi:hypothetical protein